MSDKNVITGIEQANGQLEYPDSLEVPVQQIEVKLTGSSKTLLLYTDPKILAKQYKRFCEDTRKDDNMIGNQDEFFKKVSLIVTNNIQSLKAKPSANDPTIIIETDQFNENLAGALKDAFGINEEQWHQLSEDEQIQYIIRLANYYITYDFQNINEILDGKLIKQRSALITALINKFQEISDILPDSDVKKALLNFILNILIAVNFTKPHYDTLREQRAEDTAKQEGTNIDAFGYTVIEG